MARDYAKGIYNSKAWADTRAYILKRDKYLCRRCGQPAEEVHHVEHLTAANVGDARVVYGDGNLISLCRECHCRVHDRDRVPVREDCGEEFVFDDRGQIVRANI